VLDAIVSEAPVPLGAFRQGVPPEIDRIVRRALEKDPAARFADAPAMRAALVSARRALPTRA
jgi:serine/threonine-protein kinase